MTEEANFVPNATGNPNSAPDPIPNPIVDLTQQHLEAMLRRAIWNVLILGLIAALILWKAAGWRNAAMLAAGAAISAVSILEWRRMIHYINARMDKEAQASASSETADLDQSKPSKGGLILGILLLLRLTVFAAVIYGSLRCLRGSPMALLCGLSLAFFSMLWEAFRLLRD